MNTRAAIAGRKLRTPNPIARELGQAPSLFSGEGFRSNPVKKTEPENETPGATRYPHGGEDRAGSLPGTSR